MPGGSFRMGDAWAEGYPADGETPVHEVFLDPFRIDTTAVTNAQFAQFVQATGYTTDAQRLGSSSVFHLAVAAASTDVLGQSPTSPWWWEVRGADWAHPGGPCSDLHGLDAHPVVHVSHADALAYCQWAGRRLPTEAEYEYAARGGLEGQRYPWGDALCPDGVHQANIWQGIFPLDNLQEDGHLFTCPVRSFPANGFGLFEMSGNVWEWCSDWFSPSYYQRSVRHNPAGPASGFARVTRGGSYLCHASYCNRYRVAARTSNTPDSSAGNCGFRTVGLP